MWMFFCYRKYHLKSISRTWIVSKPCLTQVAGTFPKQHRHFILGFHPFWKIKFWNFCLSLSRQAEKTLTNIFFLRSEDLEMEWKSHHTVECSCGIFILFHRFKLLYIRLDCIMELYFNMAFDIYCIPDKIKIIFTVKCPYNLFRK